MHIFQIKTLANNTHWVYVIYESKYRLNSIILIQKMKAKKHLLSSSKNCMLIVFVTAQQNFMNHLGESGDMTKIKIKNDELVQNIIENIPDFPKYTTQLMNLASQNAQATRPKVVGQMSDLIEEFPGSEYSDWVEWYQRQHPDAIENATDKIQDMIEKMRDAIQLIDKEMIRNWVKDLVLTKTFIGLKFQKSILIKISLHKDTTYRLGTPEEESKGIDGYIGDTPVSIKPLTYKSKKMLNEQIEVHMIYYEKKKDGINIHFDF